MEIINYTKITLKDLQTGGLLTILDTENQNGLQVDAGIPIKRGIDNSLDSFSFVIRNAPTKQLLKPFHVVELTIKDSDNTFSQKFCLFSDHVQSYSRYLKTYQHSVMCVELTKFLEKVKIFNLKLTNVSDDLLTQVNKALVNAEPQFNGTPFRFALTDELSTFLTGKESRDFNFGFTDLRTILDEMLSLYQMRCTVEDITFSGSDIDKFIIGYRPLKGEGNITPIWDFKHHGRIIGEELSNNGQDVAGRILARGYNTLSDKAIKITTTCKSENDTISNTNASIFLPFPISEKGFKSISHRARYSIRFYEYESADELTSSDVYLTVDIADYFIPIERFNLLSETDRRTKMGYDIGAKIINVGATYSEMFGIQVNTIENILLTEAENPARAWCEARGYIYRAVFGYFGSVPYYNSVFNIEYYPIIDTVQIMSKPNDYDKDSLLLGVATSQNAQTLNLERSGKKVENALQRTGNDDYYIDVEIEKFCNLLPVMARIDMPQTEETGYSENGYIIYKEECSILDNLVKCRYYLSKNYNSIIENDGINREKHLFDIPLESDETPIVIHKYLVFGFSYLYASELPICGSALFTLAGINASGETVEINGNTYHAKGEIKHLLFETCKDTEYFPAETEKADGSTPYNRDYCFCVPVVSYGQGKTVNFLASVLDNYSVDYSRDGYKFSAWGDGGQKITYNRYVSKNSGKVGEVDKFFIQLSTMNYILDHTEDFEDSAVNAFANMQPVAYKDFFTHSTDQIEFNYHKDRAQRPLFAISYDMRPSKSAFGKIIIGTKFAQNCNLVRDNGNGLTGLKVIASLNSTFDIEDGIVPQGYSVDYTESSLNALIISTLDILDKTSIYMRFNTASNIPFKSWAVVDSSDNIYLAINGNNRVVSCTTSTFPF